MYGKGKDDGSALRAQTSSVGQAYGEGKMETMPDVGSKIIGFVRQ
jgi:hypothetical protein